MQNYLTSLSSPSVDTQGLEAEFERLIHESDITAIADRDTLEHLNRDTFVKLVSSRTDLSRREANRIADRLYSTWRKTLSGASSRSGITELVDYLKSAQPQELVSEQLGHRLDELLAEYRAQRKSQQQSPLAGPFSQALHALIGIVMGRVDLSDIDVEKITTRLKQAQEQLGSQVTTLSTKASSSDSDRYSVVKADVETYLLNAYPWQLSSQQLQKEFWDVIYDPFADAGLMRRELMNLHRAYFTDLLESRGLLTQHEIKRTADLLEAVRLQALGEVSERYRIESAKDLQSQVYTFLSRTPRNELLSEMGTNAFRSLIEDPYAGTEDYGDRFAPFGYEAFAQALNNRNDLSVEEVQQLASRFEGVMNNVRADAEGLQSATQARVDNQWQSLQHYLRNTHKAELNPDGIKADLQTLLHEPDAGMQRVRQRMAQFDRDTLVQLLSQRQDLSEAEVNRTIDTVEHTWHKTINTPAALTAQARAQYDEATSAIARYLRETGKPELNPEGIRRDLELLMNDPQAGGASHAAAPRRNGSRYVGAAPQPARGSQRR